VAIATGCMPPGQPQARRTADRPGRPCRGGQHPRASGAAATVTAPAVMVPRRS